MLTICFGNEILDQRVDSYVLALDRLEKGGEILLRFEEETVIGPAGLAILACFLDRACEMEMSVHWEIPKATLRQSAYLQQISKISINASLLPPAKSYSYEDPSRLFMVGENAFEFSFIEKCLRKFPMDEDLQFDCKLILQELIQNVISHAGSERYYLYAGLWEKEIHMGVFDMGVSIPGKLKQKYHCEHDLEYILLALEEGVTTRRQRVGGLGLAHFKDVLRNNRGKLTIISGGAQVRYYFQTRKSQKSFLKRRLPGTWCCARIPYENHH